MSYYVPKHPSLVTVEKFFRYSAATNDLEKVAAITGRKVENVGKLNLEAIDGMIARFESGMRKDIAPMKRTIRIRVGFFKWIRLGFIPDLNAMSYYEYVDVDKFSREYVSGDSSHLLDLVAAMFRPVTWKLGKRYLIQEYDAKETEKYMRAVELMKMDQVINAVFFFSNITRELKATTDEYLITTLSNQMKIVNQTV